MNRERLISAWCETTAELVDPDSPLRRKVDERGGARDARLSPAGLQAGLECLVRGVRREVFAQLADAEVELPRTTRGQDLHDLVILAGNLPALFLQPLARAVAAGRSVILKPASSNPVLLSQFVERLIERLPELADTVEVRTWKGGDRGIEDDLFARADRLIVYGDRAAVESVVVRRRALGKRTVVHGPKTSVAIAGTKSDPGEWALRLARDVALFDQRGCLSVGAVWVPEEPFDEWVKALVAGLRTQASALPPGPVSVGEAAAIQATRTEAVMRGAAIHPIGKLLAEGTVVAGGPFIESFPVLRTLQVAPYRDLGEARAALAGQHGRIQGLAITTEVAEAAELALACGASRVAPFGELQEADATWDDGEMV